MKHPAKAWQRLGWAALGCATLACAVPPPIDGASCPCPSGFYCDEISRTCMAGTAPTPMPGEPPPKSPGITLPEPLAPGVPAGQCNQIGAPPVAQLTPTEYRFAVADLLGVELTAGELPGEIDGPTGFQSHSGNPDTEMGLRALAAKVAERAGPTLLRPGFCAAGLSDQACGELFVERFGVRAYRRPLAPAEQQALSAAFMAGRMGGDGLRAGMAAVVAAALASDSFLRRRDVALASVRPGTKLLDLDAWSIATRLAALLWRSVPDDALLESARSEALLKPDEVEQQARRMLADPKGERMLTQFFRDWLDVDDAALAHNQTQAPGTMPALTPALRASLLRSFDGFASSVFRDDVALGTLYSTPQLLADPSLASFYGLTAPVGAGFELVSPQAGQVRRGLLTAPGFLAPLSQNEYSNPVRRGAHLLRKAFCIEVPAPPPDVPPPPPSNLPAVPTTRERFEEHRRHPACASCHSTIDPLGFGLENYDSLGRWRTVEAGQPIDSHDKLIQGFNGTFNLTFSGPAEMGDAVSASDPARSCYVQQWFRYAYSRKETAADACLLAGLNETFRASEGGQTKELLLAITRTASFTALTLPGN